MSTSTCAARTAAEHVAMPRTSSTGAGATKGGKGLLKQGLSQNGCGFWSFDERTLTPLCRAKPWAGTPPPPTVRPGPSRASPALAGGGGALLRNSAAGRGSAGPRRTGTRDSDGRDRQSLTRKH